jgi:hypothetical protein
MIEYCDISLPPRGSAATGPVRGQAGLLVYYIMQIVQNGRLFLHGKVVKNTLPKITRGHMLIYDMCTFFGKFRVASF